MKPNVLIAAPVGDGKEYSINEWFSWIASQAYDDFDVCVCVNGRTPESARAKAELMKVVEINHRPLIVLVEDSPIKSIIEIITLSRERIRQYAVKGGYDFIFWLDTDTIPHNLGTIKTLLSWEKPFVSGLYFYKRTKVPVAVNEKTGTNFTIEELETASAERKPILVWGVGLGCCLMAREVFERFAFDFTKYGDRVGEDFMYCEQAKLAGYDVLLDPWILCRHYHSENMTQGWKEPPSSRERGTHERRQEDQDEAGTQARP